MAKATWDGRECDVRVDSDLESNWSVSILSGEFDPVSLIQRPAAPVIIKVRAKTRWLALDQGLRSLKDAETEAARRGKSLQDVSPFWKRKNTNG